MSRPILPFAIASLLPIPLLLLGALLGGIWAWIALAYLTVFAFALDELVSYALPGAPPGQDFPAADQLLIGLAVAHVLLMLVALQALAHSTGLGIFDRIALFLAFGIFFGQISNAVAHELIHRTDRPLFLLGQWMFISLLFGHHTSAHRHIHHRHVATENDPSTAEEGETFYEFLPRAWIGGFIAGYEIEASMREQSGKGGMNPYVIYIAGQIVMLLCVLALFNVTGLIVYLLLCAYAQLQLLLSDYVQHYGLLREETPDGALEPVSDRHSWNSGRWFTSALTLNVPHHSAHHAHPAWPFPDLALPPAGAAPLLPYGLPVMGAIALVPGTWLPMMNRRLAQWRTTSAASAPLPPAPATP